MEEKRIKAYKGFNKDMTCRGFQYEVGKEYECDGEISLCEQGFHACENPLDVLDFYNDIDGKYCEVEQSGRTETDGKKTVSSKIKINAEIGFAGLFKLGVEWLKEITNPKKVIEKITNKNNNEIVSDSGDSAKIGSSGDSAKIGSSGDSAKIGSSGDGAQIGSSGYGAQIGSSGYGAQIGSSGNGAQIGSSGDSAKIGSSGYGARIDSAGEDSVICCAGNNSMVKAKIDSWITLSKWEYNYEKQRYVPKCVKTEYVDGERIKADTWYKLENGEFIEIQ